MDHSIIRGTSLTIRQRPIQPISRQSRSNNIPRVNSSTVLVPTKQENVNSTHDVQRKSSELPSETPTTLLQLLAILTTWEHPYAITETIKAKERITHCFEENSVSLALSFFSLTTLPDVFGGMQYIQDLSLDHNYLSEIPRFLTKLIFLKILNLSYNALLMVPDYIKEFKHLEYFNAECNQLRNVSEELGRLPKLNTLMLAHNRILRFPENIYHIKTLTVEDQIPLATFADSSPSFATKWEETFQYESASSNLEIWLARYEEILKLPIIEKCHQQFKHRIGTLLDAMVNNSDLRKWCYTKARDVIATSQDGLLFSLFEMEAIQIEQRIVKFELSDVETRKEIERAFNFHRLQEFALLHAQEGSLRNNATPQEEIVDAQKTVLFYYVSHENTLDMPSNSKIPRFSYQPDMALLDHRDVRKAVEKIRCEKDELGRDYLINFVLEKKFWIAYLSKRYENFIIEHTQTFVDQMEELEENKEKMNEYDYLTQMNTLGTEMNKSEKLLFYQLSKNILTD